MVNARLHIICGNCGCNHMFQYAVKLSINDAVEPEKEYPQVSILCKNCSTIHYLEDNAKIDKSQIKIKEEVSMYGVPMKDTCHKGKECGISGLSCQNPSCPHI